MSHEPSDFKELVQWAAWQVVEGLMRGEPIQRVMTSVCMYVRQWTPPTDGATQHPGGGK